MTLEEFLAENVVLWLSSPVAVGYPSIFISFSVKFKIEIACRR